MPTIVLLFCDKTRNQFGLRKTNKTRTKCFTFFGMTMDQMDGKKKNYDSFLKMQFYILHNWMELHFSFCIFSRQKTVPSIENHTTLNFMSIHFISLIGCTC